MDNVIQINKDFHINMIKIHQQCIERFNKINNIDDTHMDDDILNLIKDKNNSEIINIQKEIDILDIDDDNIRKRINNARSNIIMNSVKIEKEKDNIEIEKEKTDIKKEKDDNLLIDNNIYNIFKPDVVEQKNIIKKELKQPSINALYKISHKQRKEVIVDLYNTAVINMNEISKYDDEIKNNLEEEIQKEASRLLQVYLETH
jgi:hypothetical protein